MYVCRRKIACKLWLKICSLLSCTAIRNGGQIYIFCSICSCTKIGATHTKTVKITSEKIESAVRNSITLNVCNYHENQENTVPLRISYLQMTALIHLQSKLKFPVTFRYWFWHLIGNRSIVLNFHQQRPVLALKRPKRRMKANKGQQSPKLQISLLSSLFNVNVTWPFSNFRRWSGIFHCDILTF